jgi:hypothetical protein
MDFLRDPGRLFRPVEDRSYRIIIWVTGAYSILVSLIPLLRLVPRPPLQLGIWLACYLLYRLRPLPESLRRWVFYLFLFVTYPALRNVVTSYSASFHCADVIAAERWLFGCLPSYRLQLLLNPGGEVLWFDYVFAVLHSTIFWLPVIISAAVLVSRGPWRMKRASVAVTILSLAGYLTYILYPVTPPWMASLEGAAPPMSRVVFSALGRIVPAGVAGAFQPSPRGAMPSLHAGVPVLILLISLREFGRRAAWVSLPAAVIIFEIVYGAEHYVVDVLAGVVYAVAAYLLVYRLLLPGGRGREGGGG